MHKYPIRIGISSCLLGQRVRFDGGHKHDQVLIDIFGRFAELVPVCPEVELGMGVPREPVHLVERGQGIQLMGVSTAVDHTPTMRTWSEQKVAMLAKDNLSGFILKKDSPSCGLECVKVHRNERTTLEGRGLFAEALLTRFPNLPIEEEEHLHDPIRRNNWIERVFAYQRMQKPFASRC